MRWSFCGASSNPRSTDRKAAPRPEWRRPRLPSVRQGRFSNPLTPRRRQLFIPVCTGVSGPQVRFPGPSIPAIASTHRLRLPQQRYGSLGERRRERLLVVFVALCFDRLERIQRGHVELQLDERQPAEQWQPCNRTRRALRPASAGLLLSFLQAPPVGTGSKKT